MTNILPQISETSLFGKFSTEKNSGKISDLRGKFKSAQLPANNKGYKGCFLYGLFSTSIFGSFPADQCSVLLLTQLYRLLRILKL